MTQPIPPGTPDLGDVPALVEQANLGPAPASVHIPVDSDTELWNAYQSAREAAVEADGPVPTRQDMRPRVETFRGRKLRVERGAEWGTVVTKINGRAAGVAAMGSGPAALNRAAEELRHYVIAADERRIVAPDAYPAEWYRGAPGPHPAVVAYVRRADERERADRAALRDGTR